jgi:endonuclease YncB( thermonuclease family)
MDFLRKSLKESDHEVICTGSSVSVQNRPGGAVISVTGYVYVKHGFTLNNALVARGLATTSNPFYKSWQEKAKQQKLGIWRNRQ